MHENRSHIMCVQTAAKPSRIFRVITNDGIECVEVPGMHSVLRATVRRRQASAQAARPGSWMRLAVADTTTAGLGFMRI